MVLEPFDYRLPSVAVIPAKEGIQLCRVCGVYESRSRRRATLDSLLRGNDDSVFGNPKHHGGRENARDDFTSARRAKLWQIFCSRFVSNYRAYDVYISRADSFLCSRFAISSFILSCISDVARRIFFIHAKKTSACLKICCPLATHRDDATCFESDSGLI